MVRRQQTMEQHPHLSVSQRNAVEDVLKAATDDGS
jgi:hypothetical protein